MKKALCPLAFLTLVSMIPAPAMVSVAAEEESPLIERTDVLDDLLSLDGFNPSAKRNDFESIYLAEYQYSSTSSADFGLYFYCYTPSNWNYELTGHGNVTAGENTVNCTFTEVGKNRGFRKFRIEEASELYYVANQREYKIESILFDLEIFYERLQININAHYGPFNVNGLYTYSSVDDVLTLHMEQENTLNLQVEGTFWMGSDYIVARNVLFSSFFSIPSDYIQNYGELSSIEFNYNLVDTEYLYHLKDGFTGNMSCNDMMLLNDKTVPFKNKSWYSEHKNDIFGADKGFTQSINDLRQSAIFRSPNFNDEVPAGEIEERINWYPELIADCHPIHSVLDAGTFDLTSVHDLSNLNDFENTLLGLFTNYNLEPDETVENIDYFKQVSLSDTSLKSNDFADKYLCQSTDSKYFESETKKAYEDNRIPYFFRFCKSGYVSQTIYSTSKPVIRDPVGYWFYMHYVQGFEILEMSFTKDSIKTAIPICSNKIDIVPNAPAPTLRESTFDTVLKIVIAIIMIVLLLFVIFKIIIPLIKWLIGNNKKKKGN